MSKGGFHLQVDLFQLRAVVLLGYINVQASYLPGHPMSMGRWADVHLLKAVCRGSSALLVSCALAIYHDLRAASLAARKSTCLGQARAELASLQALTFRWCWSVWEGEDGM